MGNGFTVYACSNMGLSGGKVFIQKSESGYEARQAISIFGSYQMREADLEAIEYNPFHPNFNDNFVRGIGDTEELALKAMKQDSQEISDSLWF